MNRRLVLKAISVACIAPLAFTNQAKGVVWAKNLACKPGCLCGKTPSWVPKDWYYFEPKDYMIKNGAIEVELNRDKDAVMVPVNAVQKRDIVKSIKSMNKCADKKQCYRYIFKGPNDKYGLLATWRLVTKIKRIA